MTTDMSEEQRDVVEIAALLHDIGKIGVPDSILKHPGELTQEQAAIMFESRNDGLTILASCCKSNELLRIVAFSGAWYDGKRTGFSLSGDDLPLGSRMIAIADAFDAMTHDRVFRKAISHDRAIAELYKCAGNQFDPVLVDHFASMHMAGKLRLDQNSARRWLANLSWEKSNRHWQLNERTDSSATANAATDVVAADTDSPASSTAVIPAVTFDHVDNLFHDKLLDCMPDGILYTNSELVVTAWNRAAAQITGISSESLIDQLWSSKLLKMRDAEGRFVHENNCPIAECIVTGRKVHCSVSIRSASGSTLQIDLLVEPILDEKGTLQGLAAVFRDATSTQIMEQKVETLHKKAIRDPLTGIANRAEFDRFHASSIERHLENGSTCSLIICDIDHFKSVNDQFGHQAGDAALVNFASVLQRSCRDGDLIARYGGEEFVMVCENCTAANATKIAEELRLKISETPLRELGGRNITASFGVTELQDGDSCDTMLRRADRGLLRAKDTGRNRVVQLGGGMTEFNDDTVKSKTRSRWFAWTRADDSDPKMALACKLYNNVPLPLVAQKLRGFIADHKAEVEQISQEKVVIRVTTDNFDAHRQNNDRPVPFLIQIVFAEELCTQTAGTRTIMQVTLKTIRNRTADECVDEPGKRILRSLKAYLMAADYHEDDELRD